MPGIVTPATIGCQIVRSSCSPRKYHGAFDGLGVWLKLACSSSGARTRAEKIVSRAMRLSMATNSPTSRWGQVWTLSCASALVCWMDPALTTVRSRCVWPPGPVAVDGGAAAVAAAARPPVAAGALAPAPPAAGAASPPLAAFRAADRASRWAGIFDSASPVGRASGAAPSAAAGGSAASAAGASAGASAAGAPSSGGAPPSSPGTGRPRARRRSALLLSKCSGTSSGMSRLLPT
jgi:hypothetical protein